jgi:hypothetical protein
MALSRRRAAARVGRAPRLVGLALATLMLGLGASAVVAGGGEGATVEAGAFFDFVAPDAATTTPGSITFGFSGTPEVIAADAELVPPTDTNLAFLGGGTPTCIEVTREAGSITRLVFVAECTVVGTVTLVSDAFGPGADGYLIGDRVAAPAELVEGQAAFAALIGVAADSAGELRITFEVDVTTGVPASFVGETEVSGNVAVLGNGDVTVGPATLPDAVIDDASRALLSEAADLGVNAMVLIVGNGQIETQGDPVLEIALTVTIAAPAPTSTPAPTAAALPDTSAGGPSMPSLIVVMMLAAMAVVGTAVLRLGMRR